MSGLGHSPRRGQQSQEMSSAEIMHHGAETNKGDSTGCHYCGGKHQSYETCPAKGQDCNF